MKQEDIKIFHFLMEKSFPDTDLEKTHVIIFIKMDQNQVQIFTFAQKFIWSQNIPPDLVKKNPDQVRVLFVGILKFSLLLWYFSPVTSM